MKDELLHPKLVLIATSAASLWVFFRAQCGYLEKNGFRAIVICSPGSELDKFQAECGCEVYPIPMARSLNLLGDLRSLCVLARLLSRIKPAIVHSHTPKAGLLGMLASWVARVPIRIHTFHGMRSETLRGINRVVVELSEKLTATLSTSSLAVSASLRKALIVKGICKQECIEVLGYGGCSGVDLSLFSPTQYEEAAPSFRDKKKIARDAQVVTYIGRIAGDKGIHVLNDAWRDVKAEFPRAHLYLNGPIDPTDPVDPLAILELKLDPSVTLDCTFTDEVALILAATDVFVSPSFREGLGVSVLEASAMKVPVVVSRVTGLVDAAEDQVTGLFVPAKDARSLREAIGALLRSDTLSAKLGEAGRRFVEQRFEREAILRRLAQYYRDKTGRLALHADTTGTIGTRKRVLDLSLGSALVVLSAPIVLIAMLAIYLSMGLPIFFRQQRGGLNGQPFTVIKLRTMIDSNRRGDVLQTDALRLTALGKLLRSLSIDELPQLWNVLRGEMSLVGPRPLLAEYLPRYTSAQARRHNVLPGITGWAQIKGRNAISWEDKFDLDLWYVDHQSLFLDMQILFLTLYRLIARRDVSAPGHATMTEFRGHPNQVPEAH